MHAKSFGNAAEDRACDHLLNLGYTILQRQFRVRGGEIDIVALDGDELVFVEVKARSAALPEDALSESKSSRMRKAADAYLRANELGERSYRFDLIAIEGRELRHHTRVNLGG